MGVDRIHLGQDRQAARTVLPSRELKSFHEELRSIYSVTYFVANYALRQTTAYLIPQQRNSLLQAAVDKSIKHSRCPL